MQRLVSDPERVISRLAEKQHGLVTFAELREAGLSKGDIARRTASGRLIRVLRGVYLVAVGLLDPPTFRRAALLSAGQGAALIHKSAAGEHGLLDRPVGVVYVGREGASAGRSRSSIRLSDGQFGHVDIARASGIRKQSVVVSSERRATVERTLVDLADFAPGPFEQAWREAQYRNLLDVDRMRETLGEGRRRPGQACVRAALDRILEVDVDLSRAESPAEFDAIRMAIAAGAPPPLINQPMTVCGRVRRPDLYWALARLIVEIDGWDGHKTRESFEDDRARDADFLSIGIVTMRFTARRAKAQPQWCCDRILQQIKERTAA